MLDCLRLRNHFASGAGTMSDQPCQNASGGPIRLLLLVTALALPAAARAELPTVDSGVRSLQECDVHALVFRVPSDGWLLDFCGHVYRSRNGGHNWRRLDPNLPPLSLLSRRPSPLRRLAWLTSRVGLIFDDRGHVARSSDGGQTWSASAVPVDVVDVITRLASSTWLCDNRGTLLRSDDDGVSWQRLTSPLRSGCQSLSFIDRDHGWITGELDEGKLWETSDGGASWSELALPVAGLGNLAALRATGTLGWLYGDELSGAAVFSTRDGGRRWTRLPPPRPPTRAFPSRLRSDGGERTFTTPAPVTTLDELARTTPAEPGQELTALDEHDSVRLELGRITFYRDGARLGETGVVSEASGQRQKLRGLLSNKKGDIIGGWSADLVYASDDNRASWYVVADAPERPLERIVMINDSRALARAGSGTLYESLGWLGRWAAVTGPLDAWEWARHVPGAGNVPSPLECLATAAVADVSLDLVEEGCFDRRQSSLALHARASGSSLTLAPPAATAKTRQLPSPRAHALIAEIVKIIEQGDGVPQCTSTTNRYVTVNWRCDAVAQTAHFSAPYCFDGDSGTEADIHAGAYEPMRADGLFALARRLATAAAP
jgi:photosystem II stability/assembly factor-like uncharacterized protein